MTLRKDGYIHVNPTTQREESRTAGGVFGVAQAPLVLLKEIPLDHELPPQSILSALVEIQVEFSGVAKFVGWFGPFSTPAKSIPQSVLVTSRASGSTYSIPVADIAKFGATFIRKVVLEKDDPFFQQQEAAIAEIA